MTPLLVLFVADPQDNLALLSDELHREGFVVTSECVTTAAEFRAALPRRPWQVILAQTQRTTFPGIEALLLLKEMGRDVPLILVADQPREEEGVESLKAGAADFVLLSHLRRLGPAIHGALRDAEHHRNLQAAQRARSDEYEQIRKTLQEILERPEDEEQRQREVRLRQAERLDALGNLARGIAHDFNNILTGILGYVDMIRLEPSAGATILLSAAEIHRACLRARDMIRQILTFGRRQAPLRLPVRVEEIVHEVIRLSEAHRPPGIQLQLSVAPHTPLALADPSQVHQVVMNLCGNALQAMGATTGKLTLAVEPFLVNDEFARLHDPLSPGLCVRLTVADTGPGMDAATLEHIFEPFYTTKPLGVGTGLGLAVVHGIVRNHEGIVTVASRPGVGTTFQVYFPAALAESNEKSLTQGSGKGAAREVLIVDDDGSVGKLASAFLQRLGYPAFSCTDPAEALVLVQKQPERFALVITDLNMPGLNGIELAERLRSVCPGLPMILTTGDGESAEPVRSNDVGFRAILDKPFTIDTMTEALRCALTVSGQNGALI